jgi:hypothetical protein
MRCRGTAVVGLCASLALSLTACGRFQAASSVHTSTSASYTGQTLPPLATTSTLVAPGRRTNAPTPTTRAPRDRCDPPNYSTIDDPSGFRLILTIAPRQCLKHSDDFTLQLEIQNISKQPLQYDSNQSQFFDIYPEGDVSRPTWSDVSCRSREAHPPVGGPITLDPGEREVRAQATYPGSPNRSDREQCRILGGLHDAVAHLITANGSTIQSAPMPMTVS